MRAHCRWLIIGLLLLGYLCLRPDQGDTSISTSMQDFNPAAYLKVSGSHLLSTDGNEVTLHGINLGGWLVTEAWMCGFVDDKDTKAANGNAGASGRSTLESLEDRFGEQRAENLMKVWQDHWITEKDLDQIHDSGFNLLRVPFSFRTLQHANGSWILTPNGQIDFGRMDWIVKEGAARGMYVIFDLHVWPGQRLSYDEIGRPGGAQIRQSMARLWTAVATHYRGNGGVAAFDLINEFPGAWGVQQALSKAVTLGDRKRVQVIEGFTFEEFMRERSRGEFPNSVFSDHYYGPDPLSTHEITTRLQSTLQRSSPVYIGEFQAADFGDATSAMDRSSTSWSSWTYKTVDCGEWGLVDYNPSLKTNIQHDSYRAIRSKWSSGLTLWQTAHLTSTASVKEDRRYRTGSGIRTLR